MILPYQFAWVILVFLVGADTLRQVGKAPNSRLMLASALKGALWLMVVYAVGSVGLLLLADFEGVHLRSWHGGH
ncbi:hypothetical protein [Roseimicrobium sp. ORNL1]|uniref:hypothetical protein n=1 Tax=Roseimicrobium sp. ORNL1 TaxID=2711231 RepID=UPI0013E19E5F|nr:hypothetical protein [Roseimicrobium sp. ORNL1]QIF02780.1 hypothetical protein G5S37_15040 [Roseimicrobium sp. ORNL1]